MLGFLHTKRAALTLLVLAGAWAQNFVVPRDVDNENAIYDDLWEAQRLIAGENPYARIFSSDMRANQRYATHFLLLGPPQRFCLGVVDFGGRPMSARFEDPHGVGADAQATCHWADWRRQ
jgi:hypothetical protein